MDTEVDTPSTELEEMMLSDWFIYKINSKRFPSSSAIFLFTNYFYLFFLLIFLSSLTILNEQIAEILV